MAYLRRRGQRACLNEPLSSAVHRRADHLCLGDLEGLANRCRKQREIWQAFGSFTRYQCVAHFDGRVAGILRTVKGK
jgi:hypothetical protein